MPVEHLVEHPEKFLIICCTGFKKYDTMTLEQRGRSPILFFGTLEKKAVQGLKNMQK